MKDWPLARHDIEQFVVQSMSKPLAPTLLIAHDFKHVDRVRNWALQIAEKEGFDALEIVEATALLHDIGLACVEQRGQHAQMGAEMAAQFLSAHYRDGQWFADLEIEAICGAIRCHSSPGGGGKLGELLRDADKLDALGAVGIMRAFTSKYANPEYDPCNIKSDTWQLTMPEFEKRFADGQGIGKHIIDQINFQISFFGDLRTETARQIAHPLVEFMKAYIVQLESEIKAGSNI